MAAALRAMIGLFRSRGPPRPQPTGAGAKRRPFTQWRPRGAYPGSMPLASSMRLAAALLCLAGLTAQSRAQGAPAQPIWTVPEIGALPDNARGRQIRRGRDLITATYAHVGPNVPDRAKRFAGNNLACSNCHLNAGTKKFAIPLFGLFGEYPRYNPRSGAEIT